MHIKTLERNSERLDCFYNHISSLLGYYMYLNSGLKHSRPGTSGVIGTKMYVH